MREGKRLFPLLAALIVLVLSATAIGFGAIAIATGDQVWRPLTELIDTAFLDEIIQASTSPHANRDEIARSSLGYWQGDLLLVDFNSRELCGIAGCALAGYRVSTQEQILAIYVPRRQLEEPIVDVVSDDGSDIPCLRVPASEDNHSPLQEDDLLCYRGSTWQIQ